MPATRYSTESIRIAAYDRLLVGVRALPGVSAASVISLNPLSGSGQVNGIAPEGSATPRSEHPDANFRFVGPEFFRTMGIAVLRGRTFTDAERPPGHAMPAVISDRTAQRLWPDQDPIGKRFSRGIPGEDGFEVVGVAAAGVDPGRGQRCVEPGARPADEWDHAMRDFVNDQKAGTAAVAHQPSPRIPGHRATDRAPTMPEPRLPALILRLRKRPPPLPPADARSI